MEPVATLLSPPERKQFTTEEYTEVVVINGENTEVLRERQVEVEDVPQPAKVKVGDISFPITGFTTAQLIVLDAADNVLDDMTRNISVQDAILNQNVADQLAAVKAGTNTEDQLNELKTALLDSKVRQTHYI